MVQITTEWRSSWSYIYSHCFTTSDMLECINKTIARQISSWPRCYATTSTTGNGKNSLLRINIYLLLYGDSNKTIMLHQSLSLEFYETCIFI